MSELIAQAIISIMIILPPVLIIYFIIKLIVTITEVSKNGKSYTKIIKLNELYNFYSIQKSIDFFDNVNSLQQLRKIIPEIRIYYAVQSNEQSLKEELKKIAINRESFKHYNKEYNQIIKEIDTSKLKGKIEKKLCSRKYLKVKTDIIINYYANYTSPAGRSEYNITDSFNYNRITNICTYYQDKEKQEILRRNFMEIERAQMSNSLRYNILKRDNYRCRICGATSSDGVKLHVDHIIPVSKGGKTTPSNLQTLCERCNIGKSNKL